MKSQCLFPLDFLLSTCSVWKLGIEKWPRKTESLFFWSLLPFYQKKTAHESGHNIAAGVLLCEDVGASVGGGVWWRKRLGSREHRMSSTAVSWGRQCRKNIFVKARVQGTPKESWMGKYFGNEQRRLWQMTFSWLHQSPTHGLKRLCCVVNKTGELCGTLPKWVFLCVCMILGFELSALCLVDGCYST
jgi:hypothetical protein